MYKKFNVKRTRVARPVKTILSISVVIFVRAVSIAGIWPVTARIDRSEISRTSSGPSSSSVPSLDTEIGDGSEGASSKATVNRSKDF